MISCKKHPQRKRKDCPLCFPQKAQGIVKEAVIEKPKVKLAVSEPEISAQMKEIQEETGFNPNAIVEQMVESFRAEVDNAIARALASMIERVDAIKHITWEHLDVPVDILTTALINNLEKEGWKWCHFYDDMWYKAAGLSPKAPKHLFQRIRKTNNPEKPDLSDPKILKKYTKVEK